MGRETYLADLYRQSVQALTQNRTEWMGLLSSVSKYYKMSFDKNVLIYVQRPDAGLLATKMGWEKQTGRYLKAGSKGIGVVDMNNPKATLAYYFDLADTRGDYEGFRRAMSAVWSLERQYQPEILDRFHKQFGTDENSIENCLCQLVGMQADAFFEKYLSRVEVKDENSVLYGLPAGAVQAEFAKLVSDSAAYIVFKKCGIKAEIFEETGAFENISHFGSLELFMGLGYYTCAIARSVLSEIHKQIEEIKEERSQRYEPRTVSETGIHERGGRDAVSEPSDIREQGVRLKTDRDVREKMEGLHDVEVPAETVGADRTGADKRADSQGGRGSRSEERNADSAASGGTADAGDRGYAGESRTHGDDNQTGGGDYPARSSVPVKIAEKEEAAEPEPVKKNTEKASEESEAEHAAEGSSFHIPQSATKENIREHKDWEEVQSLLTDTGVFPLELYGRINQVFAKETDPAVKRNAVRDIYLDYGLQKSSDGTRGIMPGKDVADFFFGEEGFVRLSWDVITHVIGSLMQNSEYIPYHEEEDAIGDFNIPDEIEDMQLGSRKDHEDGQLSLFELYPGPYEDDGKGGDQILQEETGPEEIKSGYMPFPVGSRIAYDDRIFEVLQYLDDNHTVELGDIEQLQGLHGYKVIERLPVVLIENAELLQPNYTEGEVAQTVVQSVEDGDFSEAAKKRIENMSRIGQANEKYAMDVAKEMEQRFRDGTLNYHYHPEHRLYEGGPKAKFRNNVEAIRLLKQLQQENRIATTEEQIVLARFVGWGGLANALTPGKEGWEKEYDEISELLTEEEMQSASASTLTSYYTDQKVIEFIYQALYQFGFRSGNIMDPALGTGNFFSALPESMNQSRLYGVELEPIAGGIARKLYPQADILIKGYEDTEFSDSFFDVVVGNVPFHNIKVSDRRYDRYNFKIHDYFLAKSLDKVRSGGILAVITTKFTMDKENQSVRKYIAQRAELIGAIRLPENAFKQVAGTEVTTDILFLKKREQEIIPDERNTPWLSVEKDENGIPYNSYFIDHPEMVLGTMAQETGMYGSHDFVTCKPYPDKTLSELLEEAAGRLHGQYEEPASELSEDKDTVIKEWLPATPDVKNYSYTKVGDAFYYREDSRMYRQELTGKKAERVDGMLRIRDALRELMDFQLHGDPELGWELPTMEYEKRLKELLDRLNREYDSYIKKYGYLNLQGNVMAFSKDADSPLLRSIEEEVKDEHGKKVKGEYKKTAVFHKATIRPKSMPKTADNVEEALRITMNAKGKFDLDYMQYLYRKDGQICSKEDILEELGERVYQDPAKWRQGDATSGWVLAEEYLSGYVKDKLAQAVLAEEEYPEWFGRNVEALKKVQPEPLKPEDISFVLGSTWIPVKYYQDFMYEKFATSKHNRDSNIHIEFAEYTGTYFITEKRAERDSIAANKTYGTERLNAYEIMEYTLNLKTVEVRDRQEYEDPETGEEKVRYVLNKRETLLAREKQAQIKMEFESWLFAEPERGAALTQLYNDRFNNIRPRTYNGDDLMLPDMNDAITLRKHQRDTVAIAFIHDANTDTKRAELLEKVRNGIVRVLLGSTEKMGTGLNVQDKLIALHNLDAPWRPADLTQRNGRILRQGNENDEISIFNYITEQTFDAYLWQILEQKQRYISQIMTGRSALRSCEDVDEVVIQYAEFKALAVSDPKIKRKMEVDNEVYRLQTLKSAWKSEHTDLQNKITVYYPQEIKKCTERIEHRKADAELYQKEVPQEFSITLNHRLFDERTKAGEYLKMQMANLGHEAGDTVSAGTYAGLQVMLKRGAFQDVLLCLKGEGSYQVDAGESALGNITRLENLAEKIPQYLKDEERKLGELKEQFEAAKVQAERPFSEEEKLSELLKEQVSLNLELEFADADEEGTEKAGKSHGNSIYRKLRKLAPELFEGTYTYMKFKQDGFDDLVLETIGENEYSIAHYYTQNGDRMRDPEITFMLDDTQRCIYALSYTQDNMGIYYETGDRTEKQMEDLMGFFDQWMANIKEQGFTLYKAYGEDAEYTKEEEHTEETGYTVISADNLKQMNRFDGEDMENER